MAVGAGSTNTALGRLRKTAELVRLNLKHLDPWGLQNSELVEASALFAEIGKLANAGTLLLAPAIERSGAFRKDGFKNTAEMLSQQNGTSMGAAHAAVNTAKKIQARPKTAEAVRNGTVSGAQAGVLAEAHPDDEAELLEVAERGGFGKLRDAAEGAKAARTSEEDAMEQYRRVHAERNLRSWTKNGAFHLAGSTTLDEGAALMAALEAERTRLFEQARDEGRADDPSAYAMDALVNLVTGAAPPSKARAVVRLRADAAAILRGYLEAGECCEIRDYGPIPVTIARALMLDSDVTGVVTEGNDVRSVSTTSRSISRKVREALMELYPTCGIPGCCVAKNLEVDHIHEFAKGGLTELANLILLCRAHHRMKTIYGWRIGGPIGNRTWLPPPAQAA